MNPVLILAHNCLGLTTACVESALNQSIPTEVLVYDNASSDGTIKWLRSVIQNNPDETGTKIPNLWAHFCNRNSGVSAGWNMGLNHFFDCIDKYEHVLVLNNDTELNDNFYEALLEFTKRYDALFMTGNSVSERPGRLIIPREPVPHPDFSAFLITRKAWETIGTFDEDMVHYASDLDYHLRAHRKGIHLLNSGVPFYHERSSTLKHSDPKEKRMIELQADADREVLFDKWGARAGTPEFVALFSKETFGIDA